ncbi:chemotaxis protein CheA [Limnohabitans radicicola]|uniref:Chemotaxis protein CheA n=1 Tax=Limnohabitans radicicola TaxID=2771427 RepID=A0A927IL88_9BURK|nr:chemotaxis protein CheA [Limnohabitans radicicola]MBD8050468.1 chemotaxis protein CheW [Limnohabitans radicicola]
MSDDFIETIWAQYSVETEEHIEGIESLLVRADGGELSGEEISSLFRAFHSLKGLSRVMELGALEAVAHRAEDLLGLVREGVTGLNKSTVDLLLRALDAIKGLRDIAVAERSDGQKPTALCEELEQAFRKATGGAAEPEAPAPAAASAPAAPAASAAQPAPKAPAKKAPPPQAKKLVKISASGTDEDAPDDQSIFLRLLANGLPILEQLALSIAANEDPKHIFSVANDIRRPLIWMMRASNKLGYLGITRRIQDISEALPADENINRAQGETVVDTIVAFLSDLRTLGETTGSDLGGESLAQVLSRTLRESLDHLLSSVVDNLQVLEASLGQVDESVAGNVSNAFARVHTYLMSLFPDAHCDLPLFLQDAYARAARSDLKLDADIIAVARDAVALIRGVCQSKEKKPLLNAGFVEQQDTLSQRIKDCVWAHDNASDMSPQEIEAFHASLGIRAELAQLLSSENTRELKDLIDGGSKAYLVVAHLESSEQIATSFLSWVSERGRIITNRSVFVDDESWYEMLFISTGDFDDIDAEIKQLDADQNLIKLLGQFGVDSGPAAIQYPAEVLDDPAPVPAPASAPVVAPVQSAPAAQAAPAEKTEPVSQVTTAAPAAAPPQAVQTAPTAAAAPEAAKRAPAPAAAASNVIRVPGEMLDQFMNQIGEMVLVRGQLAHVIADQRLREQAIALRRSSDSGLADMAGVAQFQRLIDLIDEQNRRLQETDALIQGALSRLQDSVMGLRVVPVELVFKRFPRMVRDLAQAQGKQIRLELTGQEVKIDKAMVESLADPLLHMVRNSADHGIETMAERKLTDKPEEAVIRIQAEQQGSRIIIRVSDDGKGIDPERVRRKAVERGLVKHEDSLLMSRDDILKFIFRAGFSTADVVTETSGRGVGMDVVRTNVMRLGGNIHLDSELGRGTTFTMQMPLSAAVQEVLLVNTANQTLAVPGRYVAELVEINETDVQTVKGRTAIILRGSFLPIVRLEELLGFKQVSDEPHRFVVVLSDGQRTLGVTVDEFVGRQELFTKDIHPRLAALPGVGGASILGDGRVVLILDGPAIYRLAENIGNQMPLPSLAAAA